MAITTRMNGRKVRIRFNWIPYILLYAAVGVMIGMGDIVNGTFQFRFFDSSFYSELGLFYGASLITLLTTIDIYINRFIREDARVGELERDVIHYVDNDVKADFEEFMETKNIKRAKKEWRATIMGRINTLNDRWWNQGKPKLIWNKGTDEQKAKSWYCRKRVRLEEKLTDEYFEDFVLFTAFKYDKIPASFVKTGTKQKKEVIHDQTVEKKGKKLRQDLAPKMILSFTWTLFITSFIWQYQDFDPSDILMIAVKVALVVQNFLWARDYVLNAYGPEKIVHDLQLRRDIIVEYISWKNNKKEKVIENA